MGMRNFLSEAQMIVPPNRYGRGCWYEFWIEECVLCGHTEEIRERRYTRKPPIAERYHYTQDACGHHFC